MNVLIPQFNVATQVTFVYRHDSFFWSVRSTWVASSLSTQSGRAEHFANESGADFAVFAGSQGTRLPIAAV